MDSGKCTKCKEGYAPDDTGKCAYRCADNCICTNKNNDCDVCKVGFGEDAKALNDWKESWDGKQLLSFASIKRCSKCKVDNCNVCDQSLDKCTKCGAGSYPDGEGNCNKCNLTICEDYNTDSGSCVCTKCKEEAKLELIDGACLANCLDTNCVAN